MARKSDDNDKRPGERVAKVMARAGLGSRREAEDWIAAGRVAVNGTVITTPALNVTRKDKVTLDGQPLPTRERTRLFLYHKPRGLITTRNDPEGRPTIFDALPKDLPRLLSIGRLDLNTEGLLLLTNDGGLARILELPETGWLRRYRVRAFGSVTQAQLDGLRDGVEVDGIQYGPIEAMLEREQASNVWLTFAIREGKNREVRNVLGHLGLQVARLIRVSYGPFQLGELAEGAVEEIPTRVLRDQLGERIARAAGADFAAPIVMREADEAPRKPVRREREAWPEHPGRERPRGERRPEQKDRDEPRGRGHDRDAPREHGDRRERGARPRDGMTAERRERPAKRTKSPTSWREAEGRPLRRKYHGARQAEPEADAAPRKTRAGLLKDRKGRRVLVQRVGEAPAPRPERDERPPRRDRFEGERPPRRERAEGGRPPRRDRPEGGSPRWRDRPEGDRPPRRERPEGGPPLRRDRPQGERPARHDRAVGDRRRERPESGRPPRRERPEGGQRREGGRPPWRERAEGKRPPRRDRDEGGRPPRRERDEGGRPPRRERPEGGRPPRRERPEGGRPPRRERPEGKRPPRRDRPEGGRPPRRDRPDGGRPPRGNRPPPRRR